MTHYIKPYSLLEINPLFRQNGYIPTVHHLKLNIKKNNFMKTDDDRTVISNIIKSCDSTQLKNR